MIKNHKRKHGDDTNYLFIYSQNVNTYGYFEKKLSNFDFTCEMMNSSTAILQHKEKQFKIERIKQDLINSFTSGDYSRNDHTDQAYKL